MNVSQNSNKPENNKVLLVVPRHWFCVAVSNTGAMFKNDAESPDSFMETLGESTIAWVDYWADDLAKEAPVIAARMGFSDALVAGLIGDSHLSYQDFDVEMGIRVPSVHVSGFDVQTHPLLMLIKRNFILTIHPLSVDRRFAHLRRYSDAILKKIHPDLVAEDKVTLLLLRLIDENNGRNFEYLRQIEELGDALNRKLIDTQTERDKLGHDIYQMKHALITYLDALWETVDVMHDLRFGDAEVITNDPGLLEKLAHAEEDVNRQIGLSEHMSEVLASGLEVMQSIYNNQLQVLNNRLAMVMTYLTIIGTAVLVPNTLATILGNSAFAMEPQDRGWYIAILVVSTVLATWLAYWWVKKMGWMPRRPD